MKTTGKYVLVGHEPTPCDDLELWARWFEESSAERQVSFDSLHFGASVSTIFVGIDKSWGRSVGGPRLFETVVFHRASSFNCHGGLLWPHRVSVDGQGSSSWAEAQRVHLEMVAKHQRPMAHLRALRALLKVRFLKLFGVGERRWRIYG